MTIRTDPAGFAPVTEVSAPEPFNAAALQDLIAAGRSSQATQAFAESFYDIASFYPHDHLHEPARWREPLIAFTIALALLILPWRTADHDLPLATHAIDRPAPSPAQASRVKGPTRAVIADVGVARASAAGSEHAPSITIARPSQHVTSEASPAASPEPMPGPKELARLTPPSPTLPRVSAGPRGDAASEPNVRKPAQPALMVQSQALEGVLGSSRRKDRDALVEMDQGLLSGNDPQRLSPSLGGP